MDVSHEMVDIENSHGLFIFVSLFDGQADNISIMPSHLPRESELETGHD